MIIPRLCGAFLLFALPAICASAEDLNASMVWSNEPKPNTLPTGTTHHVYVSKVMNREVGYCIYLPPGYAEHSDQRYPVIYNLHGANGNELQGLQVVRVLHAGITAGKWPPIILVLPNGGKATSYLDSADGKYPIETTFINELIPHIDATYRTIAKREGRCIQGFSMGGRGSTLMALKHPDLFCSLFDQSGNVFRISETFKPGDVKGDAYLGDNLQRYLENDPYQILARNLDRIKGHLRIQIFCGTKDDDHLPSIRDFHSTLLKAGVDHTYLEIEGLDHNNRRMLELYQAIWFDYHVESLRLAAEAAKSHPQPL